MYRVASYAPDGTLCKQQGGFATPADAHGFMDRLLADLPDGLVRYPFEEKVVIWNVRAGKAQRVIQIDREAQG